jgi:hypothetical protein
MTHYRIMVGWLIILNICVLGACIGRENGCPDRGFCKTNYELSAVRIAMCKNPGILVA